jgi:hypothetical protein
MVIKKESFPAILKIDFCERFRLQLRGTDYLVRFGRPLIIFCYTLVSVNL